MLDFEDLVRRPGAWLNSGPESGTVITSRVRLARNIRGTAFPGWATEDACTRLWEELHPIVAVLPALETAEVVHMPELRRVDHLVLEERHVISPELAEKGAGSGVVLRTDESASVMINEEDHLRLQALRSGMDLLGCWEEVDALDSELEERVDYAFSSELGYLTACPSNLGTGLRASVMMHLPGLTLMEEADPIIKGLNKIGLAVRGLTGEGTEATGNMYQISNQITLGESEMAIINRLIRIVSEVSEHERNARARLLEQRESYVRDYVGRAFGILSHAHVLSSRELLDLLSGLHMGIEFSLVGDVDVQAINQLIHLTQPGHLQIIGKRELDHIERDITRASIVRERLQGAHLL